MIEERDADPDFLGSPYSLYGGQSLHTRSHGEAYLTLMNQRVGDAGIYLMDEPEAALSPQRQLALLAMFADRLKSDKTQFIVATHSPILMTIPGAQILQIDDAAIRPVALEETEHYAVTKAILENPASFWKHLVASGSGE